jgi:hypothetical protein
MKFILLTLVVNVNQKEHGDDSIKGCSLCKLSRRAEGLRIAAMPEFSLQSRFAPLLGDKRRRLA